MELTFDATHTHLYPGHEGMVREFDPSFAPGERRDCAVLFSDGAAALGSVTALSGGKYRLDLGAYTTLAGTAIPEKSWVAEIRQGVGQDYTFRIVRKAETAERP